MALGIIAIKSNPDVLMWYLYSMFFSSGGFIVKIESLPCGASAWLLLRISREAYREATRVRICSQW